MTGKLLQYRYEISKKHSFFYSGILLFLASILFSRRTDPCPKQRIFRIRNHKNNTLTRRSTIQCSLIANNILKLLLEPDMQIGPAIGHPTLQEYMKSQLVNT